AGAGRGMKILFVTDRRVKAGSVQAVARYVRARDELGHTVAPYGPPRPAFPRGRLTTGVGALYPVVLLLRSAPRPLSRPQPARPLTGVPRRGRAILDADGMYSARVEVNGYDRNHANESERREWLAYYEQLADKILQPTFAPLEPGARALPFYGYDPAAQAEPP